MIFGHSKILVVLAGLWVAVFHTGVNAKDVITIGNVSAAPGQLVTGKVIIKSSDYETFVPLTIINGKKEGKTLVLVAGIHGSEYSPIIALQNVMPTIDPDEISGAIIAVHVASMPSYIGRTIYISPADGKNLNRSFPGKADGTLTERLAYFLTHEIFTHADAVLDIHSGDGNEQLRPSWVGWYSEEEDEKVVEASRKMAYAFGLQYANAFKGILTPKSKAIWAGSAAVAMGIPSIDVEAGGMGIINPYAIKQIEEGVRRMMDHLKILPSNLPPVEPPIIFGQRHSVNAPQDGSWFPLVDTEKMVVKGEVIGYMTDWYGNRIFEVEAPVSGMLILRLEAPPVKEGELLITVAEMN